MNGEKRKNELSKYMTCELVEELKGREGVETHTAGPDARLEVKADGPVVVLVVVD